MLYKQCEQYDLVSACKKIFCGKAAGNSAAKQQEPFALGCVNRRFRACGRRGHREGEQGSLEPLDFEI